LVIASILIAYFAVMILLGLYSRKKAKEADDFYVAGRKGSTFFITGSLLVTKSAVRRYGEYPLGLPQG
jgi:Na+/proline symporter